jgi:hypothetical protein
LIAHKKSPTGSGIFFALQLAWCVARSAARWAAEHVNRRGESCGGQS